MTTVNNKKAVRRKKMVEKEDSEIVEWISHNTLPLVFKWLDSPDVLRCCAVCKLWRDLALDPILWRSVILTGYRLNIPSMANFLCQRRTCSLKIIDCEFLLFDDLLLALETMTELRKFAIAPVNVTFMEKIPEYNPHLTSLNANFICGFPGRHIKLDFLNLLPNITELKIHCDREMHNLCDSLNLSKKLQCLSLTGVTNLNSLNLENCKIGLNGTLKYLSLGECANLPKSFADNFIKSLTTLETLRLEDCRECYLFDILKNISTLKNLNRLELVKVRIECDFDQGLKLCNQIKILTLVPYPHRYYIALYNTRIFSCVTSLKHSLNSFTWGFLPTYLTYVENVLEQPNSVHLLEDIKQPNKPTFDTLDRLQHLIASQMPNTKVIVGKLAYKTVPF
ncbi:F-box/LRR-repeat protein 7-like [Sitophilus oryzae]|uniref:F-box/LRR-repeat protein 7-like n=1 Tax=Sitophilus oryzae TaxID=7048 RepID=A0A6J2YPU6_SITOR|nr:F-box/LRR-repeat protein 7-like [Sitophilus oryzae]